MKSRPEINGYVQFITDKSSGEVVGFSTTEQVSEIDVIGPDRKILTSVIPYKISHSVNINDILHWANIVGENIRFNFGGGRPSKKAEGLLRFKTEMNPKDVLTRYKITAKYRPEVVAKKTTNSSLLNLR
ncbi:hypothetical protein ThvES_00017640 [Thiovulum sp. ES]|nr:hypothetical protein ThvES_00017640 [Thiovulum sp. ES]